MTTSQNHATHQAWVPFSLLAMICFALQNFLLSTIGQRAHELAAHANVSAIFVIWMAGGATGLAAILYFGPRAVLDEMQGNRNIILIVIAGVIHCAGMMCLALALAADPLSAGPITAMLPLNALFVSLLTWLILHERLGSTEIAGICIAVAGPFLMALADTSHDALSGIYFGVLCAVFSAVSNFLRRLAVARGAKNASVVITLLLVIGATSVFSIGFSIITGRGMRGLATARLTACAMLTGILWVLGSFLFQVALTSRAGPASAIANAHSVGVLLLQLVFLHHTFQAVKLIGMCACISGVVILSFAPKPKEPHIIMHANQESVLSLNTLQNYHRQPSVSSLPSTRSSISERSFSLAAHTNPTMKSIRGMTS